MPNCPRCGSIVKETAEHAFYNRERASSFWDHVGEWTARIETKQLVLLDVGYVVNNVLPQFQVKKRVVFLATLAVDSNGDLDDAKEEIVWRCKIFSSWSDFIL